MERIHRRLDRALDGNWAAKAAVDIALHDLWAKQCGKPLYRLLGLGGMAPPPTSFTIAIDNVEAMQQRVEEEATGFEVIKIKVGAGREEETLSAIREVWGGRIRVDADAAWTAEQAVERIRAIEPYDWNWWSSPWKQGIWMDGRS